MWSIFGHYCVCWKRRSIKASEMKSLIPRNTHGGYADEKTHISMFIQNSFSKPHPKCSSVCESKIGPDIIPAYFSYLWT